MTREWEIVYLSYIIVKAAYGLHLLSVLSAISFADNAESLSENVQMSPHAFHRVVEKIYRVLRSHFFLQDWEKFNA